jgi:hypothetical protein
MHTLIPDEHRLSGATIHGYSIPVYDDGNGPVWLFCDSLGARGICRAATWEDAWGICEDEFFPEADETTEELVREYGFQREHHKIVWDALALAGKHTSAGERICLSSDYVDGRLPAGMFIRWATIETPDAEAWPENELFQESFGFRPSGPKVGDVRQHGIYAKDLNGERLEELTVELMANLGITLATEV